MTSPNLSENNPLSDKIAALPMRPGVYLFKDERGEIIYVGKAIRLRSRVRSYFRNDTQASAKTKVLVKNIVDLDYMVVGSEVEALILENNLIKQHRPRYNVRLRDDKNYLYLKLTDEVYPQLLFVRRLYKDSSRYFGPYTSGSAIRETVRMMEKIFPYRKCKQPLFREETAVQQTLSGAEKARRVRPCLEHQMGRCIACDPAVSPERHQEVIYEVRRFLEGQVGEVRRDLEQKMREAALEQSFERAAVLRDRLQALEHLLEKQQAVMTDAGDRDVFGLAVIRTKAQVQLFRVRQGQLIGREEFVLDCAADCEPGEVLERVILDYYDTAREIPPEILLPVEIESEAALPQWLKQRRLDLTGQHQAALSLYSPQRGDKREIVDLANNNAKQRLAEQMGEWMSREQRKRVALQELQEKLQLPRRPQRIECYDISHFGGEDTVASMVVFQEGEPRKSDYRKFKIQTAGEADDYAAMREVLFRRFGHLQGGSLAAGALRLRQPTKKEFPQLADLIEQNQLDSTGLAIEHAVVLKAGKNLIGFARAKPVDSVDSKTGAAEIASLWVDPAARGSRFGYQILTEIIKRETAGTFYVVVPESLSGYYAGFGFVPVRQPPETLLAKQSGVRDGVQKVILRFDKKLRKKEDLSFRALPDLVVVDGGKGQLSSAVAILRHQGLIADPPEPAAPKANKNAKRKITQKEKGKPDSPWTGYAIAIVGLAKEREEIYLPGTSQPVPLSIDSQASLLLQAARDEAHRFANTFQRQVSGKRRLPGKRK